jgi:hypothetical protein
LWFANAHCHQAVTNFWLAPDAVEAVPTCPKATGIAKLSAKRTLAAITIIRFIAVFPLSCLSVQVLKRPKT